MILNRLKVIQEESPSKIHNNAKQSNVHPLALAIAIVFTGVPVVSHAANYVVTSTGDSGPGTLRQAIFLANNNTGSDVIEFALTTSPPEINLSSELLISDSVTIKGPVAGDKKSIILDGQGSSRIISADFQGNSGHKVTLENMTLRNGYFNNGNPASFVGGGAIFIKSASLVLNNTHITDSTAKNSHGGGIYTGFNPETTISNSIISNNMADSYGGGVFTYHTSFSLDQSTVTNNISHISGGGIGSTYSSNVITESTISNNAASDKGGGMRFNWGSFSLENSTISNNLASKDGGGIYISNTHSSSIKQSTISKNDSNDEGGGIYVGGSPFTNVMTIEQSTITKNRSYFGLGEGIAIELTHSSLSLTNSILSKNGSSSSRSNFHDISSSSPPASNFNVYSSLFGDPLSEITGNSATAYYDLINDPQLGPLQFNSGSTQTHKPKIVPTTQVINTGNNSAAAIPSVDQRGAGFPRIIDNQVDMGAVEVQNISGGTEIPPSPHEVVTRRDMAREILKAIEGEDYVPPNPNSFSTLNYPVTGIYTDVGITDINAVFIEELQRRGFTEGCATDKFCPHEVVTKEQMAKVFIKAKGIPITVNTNNLFYDVPVGFGGDSWQYITEMRDNSYTSGCGTVITGTFPDFEIETKFCPRKPVTREWFNELLATF